jgi:hypothetical protein
MPEPGRSASGCSCMPALMCWVLSPDTAGEPSLAGLTVALQRSLAVFVETRPACVPAWGGSLLCWVLAVLVHAPAAQLLPLAPAAGTPGKPGGAKMPAPLLRPAAAGELSAASLSALSAQCSTAVLPTGTSAMPPPSSWCCAANGLCWGMACRMPPVLALTTEAAAELLPRAPVLVLNTGAAGTSSAVGFSAPAALCSMAALKACGAWTQSCNNLELSWSPAVLRPAALAAAAASQLLPEAHAGGRMAGTPDSGSIMLVSASMLEPGAAGQPSPAMPWRRLRLGAGDCTGDSRSPQAGRQVEGGRGRSVCWGAAGSLPAALLMG